MSHNLSFQGTAGKLRLPVRSGLRPPPAPELKRWAPSAVNPFSCALANGTRVATAHAAAPSAAAAFVLRLRPGRQAPARASFTRRCLSACGKGENTFLPVRSGNHSTVRFLANALALARAFAGASLATVVSSSGRGNPRGCRTAVLTPGAVSRRLTFARAQFPVPSHASSPNPPVERDRRQAGLAGSLRGFAAPAAPHLAR